MFPLSLETPETTVWTAARTSLLRNCTPLGVYSRTMPRDLRWPYGGGLFLVSEVPLQTQLAIVFVAQLHIPAQTWKRESDKRGPFSAKRFLVCLVLVIE